MPRLKLTLAYIGTPYSGWQIQEKADPPPTVQGELERALACVCGQAVRVFGAGRTDAGVHADGQIAHCDVPELCSIDWRAALNIHLPPDIRVLEARFADPAFHACFSAHSKIYRYDLRLSHRILPPRLHNFIWVCGPLDMSASTAVFPLLIGRHDFRSLQNRGTPIEDAVRTIFSFNFGPCPMEGCLPEGERDVISVYVEADGFLKQMVRNLVGLLVAAGRGRFDPAGIPQLLAARDRRQAPPGAPAHGLTLLKVRYDAAAFEAREE